MRRTYLNLPERSLHCRYKFTEANCIHGEGCKNLKEGRDCRIGMRLQRTQLITGAHQDICTLPTPCRMRSSCLAAQCKRCPQACCSACMLVCVSARPRSMCCCLYWPSRVMGVISGAEALAQNACPSSRGSYSLLLTQTSSS